MSLSPPPPIFSQILKAGLDSVVFIHGSTLSESVDDFLLYNQTKQDVLIVSVISWRRWLNKVIKPPRININGADNCFF